MKKKVLFFTLFLCFLSLKAQELTATFTVTDESCNLGQITINASGGDGNYVYAFAATGASPTSFSTTNTFQVSAGSYDVYVRDKGGLSGYTEITEVITVNSIPPLAITLSVTQPNCGGYTGNITVAVSGGASPYNYQLDNYMGVVIQPYSTTSSFTGLLEGTYTVSVQDANGCIVTEIVTLTTPAFLTGSAVLAQPYTCTSQGQITFSLPTGGTPPYQYGVNGVYSTSLVKDNLAAGNYDLTVRDANGCEIMLPTITIDPLPAEPNLGYSVDYNCDGTGNITVTPTDVSYTYTLDGGAVQTSNVFNNLSAGTHTVEVDYGGDCTTNITAVVISNNELHGTMVATDVTCNGDSDGTITVETINFSGSYEYSIDGGANWSTATTSPHVIQGLTAGMYDVALRSSETPSCSVFLGSVAINESPVIAVAATLTKEVSCDSGATIEATATGGNGAYEYNIDGGTAWQTSSTFEDIAAGTYQITVKDSNGCFSSSYDITVNPPLNIAYTAIPTLCYDGTNGEIAVTVTEGNGDYQFSLNGGTWVQPSPLSANTHTFTGLTEGTYTVSVRDSAGCEGITNSYVINPKLEADYTLTNSSCDSGTVVVNAFGGEGNYAYAIVPTGTIVSSADFSNASSFNLTSSGVYDLFVRDNNGVFPYCESIKTIDINNVVEPILLNGAVTVTEFGCASGNVSNEAVVNVDVNDISGGSGSYTRAVFQYNNGTPGDLSDDIIQDGSNFTFSTSNILGGEVAVTVYDSVGCSVSTSATIAPFNEISNLVVTVNKVADCATGEDITVTYSSTSFLTPNFTVTGASTGTLLSNTIGVFSNLMPDTYTIDILNPITGCKISAIHEVLDSSAYQVDINSITGVTCFGDNSGTVVFGFSPNTPYTGSYNYEVFDVFANPIGISGNGQGITTVTGLGAGDFFVAISMIDSPFCNVQSSNFSVESPAIALSATTQTTNASGGTNGSIIINASGGIAPYEYSIDGGITYIANNAFTDLQEGNYNIAVRDVNGCVITMDVVITTDIVITDNDGDGVSDMEDLDDDNDGILDTTEANGQPNPDEDDDNDGVLNFVDPDLAGFVDANADGVNDNYDADLDGKPNHFDLDSDNDNLFDVAETYGTDIDGDGKADDTDGDATNNNGIPSTAGTGIDGLLDTEADGLANHLDNDSDNDGNLDGTDPNPLVATTADDILNVKVGESGIVNVLVNDDFLPGDLVTISKIGGTASGTATFDTVGNLTYTPASNEGGQTVTIAYQVCNNTDTTDVCETATVTITVERNAPGPDVPFTQRIQGGVQVRGNITFAANNILNRDAKKTGELYKNDSGTYYLYKGDDNAEVAYNSDLYVKEGSSYYPLNNGQFYMDYVDVDDADGIAGNDLTFSSSKSTLNVPDNSKIVFAGLYWAGVYPYESWETQGTRTGTVNNIKFKTPEGDYEDIVGDIIYDNGVVGQSPYVCFKDVTNQLTQLTNPNGEYYAANIKAVVGKDEANGLGGSAGWNLVVVYENENESLKSFSIFDGFATVDGVNDANVNFSGFVTLPSGPVRAKLLTASLEGDAYITGDQFQIQNQTGVYLNVSNSLNPVDNYFNSTITKYNQYDVLSTNTLGFDVDVFDVKNPNNSIIQNNQTSLDVRFTTSGDVYWPFLAAMAIELEDVTELPNAVNDMAEVDKNGVVVISIFDNDENISVSDVFTIMQPANGQVVINDNGTGDISDDTITYTPDADFVGVDTFAYVISNDKGDTDTATVTVTVNEVSQPLEMDLQITQIQCPGECGEIKVTATGGTGNYTYELQYNGTTIMTGVNDAFTVCNSGSYAVVVSDGTTSLTRYLDIVAPYPVTINSVSVTPSGILPSGTIEVGVIGGSGVYEYQLNNGVFTSSNVFAGLQAGSYVLTVRDSNGCQSATFSVTLNAINIDNAIALINDILEVAFKDALAYQWINADSGDRISGATNRTFKPLTDGRYQVEMTVPKQRITYSGANKVMNIVTTTDKVLSPVVELKNGTLGTDTFSEEVFKIFPNPAETHVVLPSKTIGKVYKVYSLLGDEVSKGVLTNEKLTVNELSSGIYLLKVEGYKTLKFVKK
ncbi:exported hypothetical protein [Tenacibaculum sp. 190524A02b]|uniref:Secretion system C-terminal sorting domain-containing protein n=1 Tax=Tenacibaculum vairaonense TaxID=3137860 RepID=A0ABM9PH80_9FLAO